jgi:two-component system chemotaxis response regulator CheY
MRILVLDDHDGFRREVVDMLARNGHESRWVATAEEAVSLVENGDFDFVLVDFQMPVHNGLWFMEHAKLPPKTKALLVTAHVQKQVITRMFEVGASGYIIKPFDEADLLRNLAYYAGRKNT